LNEAARTEADPALPPGLPGCLQSRILTQAGFRHAFFTRHGGASEGPFRSLSFSTAVGDRPEHVDENLRRAGGLLGVEPERILYLSQVHGRVVHYYAAAAGARTRSETLTLEGDAIGGTEPGSAYGVRSADCVPILLADVRSGAVMAVHAGWRGVVCGVIEAAVERLRAELEAPPELLAAVGPHISCAAFEVSEEVAAELRASCPAGAHADSAVVRRPEWVKPHVDLRFVVSAKLQSLGLNEAAIEHVGGCTVLEPEEYFSFRRDGKTSGRHLSAIVPKPFPA
jgi:YfiH family protein